MVSTAWSAFSIYEDVSLKEKANDEFDRYVQVNEIAKANTTLQKNIATELKDGGGGVFYYSTEDWAKTGVTDQYVLNGVFTNKASPVIKNQNDGKERVFLHMRVTAFGLTRITGLINKENKKI